MPAASAPPRHRHLRQELADGSAAAHAHEQPRSRSGGEAERARRLRRHRPRRARLGELRPHRRIPAQARRRPDAAGAIGQAGRRVPHARRCAARADRQFQHRAALGDAGALQRARSQGPDDVRPDDGRLLDLHRQPGHRAGHLRDVRGDGAAPLRRQPRRQMDSHRRPRRHGRRAAAGRRDGGRLDAGGGMPAEPHRDAAEDRLSRCAGQVARRGAGHDRAVVPGEEAAVGRACSAMRPRFFPSWCGAACGPTW